MDFSSSLEETDLYIEAKSTTRFTVMYELPTCSLNTGDWVIPFEWAFMLFVVANCAIYHVVILYCHCLVQFCFDCHFDTFN